MAAAAIVSNAWLRASMAARSSVRVIDATFHMPATGRIAHTEYLTQHIPGAGFFDVDNIVDKTTDLPHMLPTKEDFAAGDHYCQ
jgi:thiosulfate/3-mercaptopyruvate sulfurtransferase